MFEIVTDAEGREGARIKVIGVGGAGGNAIQTMIASKLSGVDFIAANTDMQALDKNKADMKIQLGKKLTRGLGAGANPDIGREAAIESCEVLAEELENVDMVFITAGMGGGTGTGAAGVIADIARQQGALTVGVVTKPFSFEGQRRSLHAELGISALKEKVDTLIIIPNDKLLNVSGPKASILNTFRRADEVLLQAVRGISDLINVNGLINLDFADIRTIMFDKGVAIMGIGMAEGENRAEQAVKAAISSPLLEDISMSGATGVIINITGDQNLSLTEVNEASSLITDMAHPSAEIIFGAVIDEKIGGHVRVTVIATGFQEIKSSDQTVKNSSLIQSSSPSSQKKEEEKKEETPSQKTLARDRLLKKAKDYREAQNFPQVEMEEKNTQLTMGLGKSDPKKDSENTKKKETLFGGKSFLKQPLSFFLDD